MRAEDNGVACGPREKGFHPPRLQFIVPRVKRLIWLLVILATLFRLGFFGFALQTGLYGFTKRDMSTHGGIPIARLYLFVQRSFLQV